jgi:hypothetical protein
MIKKIVCELFRTCREDPEGWTFVKMIVGTVVAFIAGAIYFGTGLLIEKITGRKVL